MTKESTGKVLEGIINDSELAGQVADGDYTGFADEDLTDAERALLQAAASELGEADVSGFAIFVKLGDIKGELLHSTFPRVDFESTQKVFGYLDMKY